jgi:hypothetical protein
MRRSSDICGPYRRPKRCLAASHSEIIVPQQLTVDLTEGVTGNQSRQSMGYEFCLAGRSGGREQHRGCIYIRSDSEWLAVGLGKQSRPWLHPRVVRGAVNDETTIRRED